MTVAGMGREKKTGPGAPPGTQAKERHKKTGRDVDYSGPIPPGLRAKPDLPNTKLKHHSYYEFVENKDKKKKLESQVTNDKNPPPGFDFVPIGNPELTQACKEISREQDAMIFIVTTVHNLADEDILQHMNRIGHHVRQTIVEQARTLIGDSDDSSSGHIPGEPEPIPETQEEINEQADAALRDLFPRIPHTDRTMIIDHAFRKGAQKKGEARVGLAKELTLSRRVQLAVLAHIRHTHTRYDQLLRETTYENARRAVQALCLEIIVKWRGDEETGRDQLDEILREVIVISDSEGEDEDQTESDEDDSDSGSIQDVAIPGDAGAQRIASMNLTADKLNQLKGNKKTRPKKQGQRKVARNAGKIGSKSHNERASTRKAQRGFKRYQAALDEARSRVRREAVPEAAPSHPAPMFRSISHGSQPWAPPQANPAYHAIQGPSTSIGASRMGPIEPYNAASTRPIVDRMDQQSVANSYSNHRPSPYGWAQVRIPGPSHQRMRSIDSRPDHGLSSSQLDQVPTQKLVVRSEQLQDYLLPSIEPRSPGVNQSSPPVFVRSVPSTHSPRPLDNPSKPVLSYERPYSPSRANSPGSEPAKRRRVASEHFERAMLPTAVNHKPAFVVSERRRESPVRYPVEQIKVIPLRQPPQDASLQRPPAPAPRKHYIDDQGAILREDPGRPIVVEDWAVPRERILVVPRAQRGYRERSPLPQKHEIIEIRRPVYTHRPEGLVHRAVAMESMGSHVRDDYERRPVEYVPVARPIQHFQENRSIPVVRPKTVVHRREIFEDRYEQVQPAASARELPTFEISESTYTAPHLQDRSRHGNPAIRFLDGHEEYEQQQKPLHEFRPMRQDNAPPSQAGRPWYAQDQKQLHEVQPVRQEILPPSQAGRPWYARDL